MSDTKTPGEKKLTLSLKPRTETGAGRGAEEGCRRARAEAA
jgi:hypothetical protein